MANLDDGLNSALIRALRSAKEPLDCNELYAMQEVKEFAPSPNRVSDYLGGLWRKGYVTRSVTSSNERSSRARYAYQWKQGAGQLPPTAAGLTAAKAAGLHVPNVLADRPSMLILEDGKDLTIELANFVITIRQK